MNLKGLFAGENRFKKILLTAFIAVASFVLCSTATILLFNIFSINNKSLLAMKAMQFANSVGLFIIPPLLTAYLLSRTPKKFLSLQKTLSLRAIFLTIVFMILAVPFINYIAEWNANIKLPGNFSALEQWMRNIEDAATAFTEKFMQTRTFGGLLSNIFLMAIIPAMGEELFFRGLLQTRLSHRIKNAHAAVWITAIIFSAFHLQFYGFIPRLLLGAYLGYLLVWSGSIWLPVLAHFINNAAAVVAYFLFQNGHIALDPDKIGVDVPILIIIVNAFVLGVIVFLQKQKKALFLQKKF